MTKSRNTVPSVTVTYAQTGPDQQPNDLRAAHDRNDETLERIHISRRFKNDAERLEKLFDRYTQMTTKVPQR